MILCDDLISTPEARICQFGISAAAIRFRYSRRIFVFALQTPMAFSYDARTRRAAAMEEVAATLREFGLPDRMASATVDWRRQIGALGFGKTEPSLDIRADEILGRLPR